MRFDLPKLTKIPNWFIQWLYDFGPDENFLPHFVLTKFKLFHKTMVSSSRFKSYLFVEKETLFQFLIYFHIQWIMCWKYTISTSNNHLTLCDQVFIR